MAYKTITKDDLGQQVLDAAESRKVYVPKTMTLLPGFVFPTYSGDRGPQYEQFLSWVDATIEDGDPEVIRSSVSFLRLHANYRSWLDDNGAGFAQDRRVETRLREGLGKLEVLL